VDDAARGLLAAAVAPLAFAGQRLRLGRILHAARLDLRPTRSALQPDDLIAQRRYRLLQFGHLAPQRDHPRLQLGRPARRPGRGAETSPHRFRQARVGANEFAAPAGGFAPLPTPPPSTQRFRPYRPVQLRPCNGRGKSRMKPRFDSSLQEIVTAQHSVEGYT